MLRFEKRILLLLICFIMAPFFLSACDASREPILVDGSLKKEVVYKTAEYMKDYYYDADIGNKMADHIIVKFKNGDYDTFYEMKKFCKQVTTDLRDICHDRHIFVFYAPEEAREVAAKAGLLSPEETKEINRKKYERSKSNNFGFHEVKIMEGNIGYIELRSFSDPDWAKETAIEAMQTMAETDAIIFDLRKNGGGKGTMVKYLSSYFFGNDSMPMSFTYYRSGDTAECWTDPMAPAIKFPEKDLYILTSKKTFSAGEEFAYNMQVLDRATIIGENTKGGAHPVEVKIIKESILTQISIGNSFHPHTKANWEGEGVRPHITVPADGAFKEAYIAALQKFKKSSDNSSRKEYLQSIILKYE